MMGERGRGVRLGEQLLLPAVAGIAFFATMFAVYLARESSNVAAIWFPNGILLAALMIRPDRAVALLCTGAVAGFAANIGTGHDLQPNITVTVGNMIEVGFAAWAIRRWAGPSRLFVRVAGVVRFSIVAGIAAPLLGATLAATTLGLDNGRFFDIWSSWAIGDALGLLIVTPMIVILNARLRKGPDAILSQRSPTETTLLLAGLVAVSAGVFSIPAEPALFLLMPLVLVATFRMGPFGAAAACLVIAAVGTWQTVHGIGPITGFDGTTAERILDLQLLLGALFLSALPVAAALAERQALAADLAAACDVARRAAESFYDQASTDELTGVATRRRFLERLREEIATAHVRGSELALVIIDVDHFKAINDAYGHPAGDAVLRALADICRSVTRTGDTVGRLGGEEFAILMPGTNSGGAASVCERLRRTVETHRVEAASGASIGATVSLGLVMLADHDGEQALADADRALYEAKRAGRNRLAIAA